jgi:hypothetical protein
MDIIPSQGLALQGEALVTLVNRRMNRSETKHSALDKS